MEGPFRQTTSAAEQPTGQTGPEEWHESRDGQRFNLHADRWQLSARTAVNVGLIRRPCWSPVLADGAVRTLMEHAKKASPGSVVSASQADLKCQQTFRFTNGGPVQFFGRGGPLFNGGRSRLVNYRLKLPRECQASRAGCSGTGGRTDFGRGAWSAVGISRAASLSSELHAQQADHHVGRRRWRQTDTRIDVDAIASGAATRMIENQIDM